MNEVAVYVLVIAASYLLGAVPWGLLIGRWTRGVDIRETGSGNIGSSNVLRTAGAKAAVAALLLDVAKGAVPVLAARAVADAAGMTSAQGAGLQAAAALSALAGHSWPVYLKFSGGKGVATGVGGLFVLYPLGGLVALVSALILMRLTRYISLGSIIGVTIGAGSLVLFWLRGDFHWAYALHGVVGWAIIVGRHHGNIRRLISGTEARLGDSAAPPQPQLEG
ncbi:MAG: glycerol-3-phosphate 1-O-acyltransferase PlsY [Chloroflexota bacterium]|nr:glycerol-3-phosphate 1-O-acyltransferase PlsY [Chloroflexota bacterium]MDE2970039.1 glycerol-3-phosphate 1-O-acyltransferase PlsY [Chloroflexota bacterium]